MIIITWNVVTKNFHANESLLTHLREQVIQLEEYLQGFPPDSVHLLIEVDRDLKKDTYTAVLSLRLPKNILRSRQAAKEVKQALDGAVKDLANQLALHKPNTLEKSPRARFSEQAMAIGTGPQNYEDIARDQKKQQQQQPQEVHA